MDSDQEEEVETPPSSPMLAKPPLLEEERDDASDSSWETESQSKSARKSARPKVFSRPYVPEDYDGPLRKRGVRCMECSACLRKDDCAKCEMCKDKKKFGGPGVKKQACM